MKRIYRNLPSHLFNPLTRILGVLLLCLYSLGIPVAHAQNNGPQYTVQAGDTLYDIARRFGVPLDVLQAANPDVNPAALAVGQTLTIPGFEGVTGTLGAHALEPGESLDSLALRFGLQRDTLIRLNRIVNPDRLYINEFMVMVTESEAGAAMPNGEMFTTAGAGLLALAAAHNQNPWALAEANRLAHLSELPPQAGFIIPGGERTTKALPFPIRDVTVTPLPPAQGRTLSIHLITSEPLSITGALGDWPLHFNVDPADPNSQFALLGIYRLAEPNLYALTLTVSGADGQMARFAQALPVRASDFGADPPLTVDPATLDSATTGPELEQIQAIVSAFTSTRYWDGVFALPSVGGLSSRFGSLRSYNGGPYDNFHGGVDFRGGEDRPITAPAPGVVVFTGALTVRGNATIIDHGWGVFTGYWHQSAINVQAGQYVNTGDILGYQGATGRVTGPHLHWELWVGGFQVNPLEWTETAFP